MTATNRESIYAATLQAARSIAGESSVIRVLVADEADDLTVVVAAVGGREDVVGRHDLALDPAATGSATGSPTVPTRCAMEESEIAGAARASRDESAFLLERSAVHEGRAARSPRRRQRRHRAPEAQPRHPRSAHVPGRPRARQRGADRGPAPPADRGPVPLPRPELHRRRHGRRRGFDRPLRESVGRRASSATTRRSSRAPSSSPSSTPRTRRRSSSS